MQPVDRLYSPMGRAIIHNPKDSSCFFVGSLSHDLVHQAAKRGDACFAFAAAKKFSLVYIEGRNISPCPTSFIFMFYPDGQTGLSRIRRVPPSPSLDAGLVIGTQNKFIFSQLLAFPNPLVKVQDSPCFLGKLRVSGKNPAPMLPGLDGILMKPAPYGATAEFRHQTRLAGIPGNLRRAPARNGHLIQGWQFTGDCLHLNDDVWGEKTGDGPVEGVPPGPPDVAQRNVCATC